MLPQEAASVPTPTPTDAAGENFGADTMGDNGMERHDEVDFLRRSIDDGIKVKIFDYSVDRGG